MIYLHKFLPFFLSPIGVIWLFLVLTVFFKRKVLTIAALIALTSFSLPVISNKLMLLVESGYDLLEPSEIENSDAIVVLSGMLRPVLSQSGLKYEWTDASDRFFAGVALSKLRKAPVLIFTRGKLPWTIGEGEGEYLRSLAIDFGVDKESILLTKIVQNTEDEALAIAELIGVEGKKIILVSSAFHLTRASQNFLEVGFEIQTFPVDFRRSSDLVTPLDFIPNAEALKMSSLAIREMLGRFYYHLKYQF